VRAVVGRVEHDRIVGDAEIVERLEQLADVAVVLDHAIGLFGPRGQPRLVAMLGVHVCARVHPGRVEPTEERDAGPDLPLHEIDRGVRGLVVDVSMRFLVSGPVSSIVCRPTRPQRGCSVRSSVSVAGSGARRAGRTSA
jgi:hypothetical protein